MDVEQLSVRITTGSNGTIRSNGTIGSSDTTGVGQTTQASPTGEVRLNVRRWAGPGRQVPFLLVHGLSSNARLWDEVAEMLAEAGHPAYAVDLRGHGESDAPSSGYDTATAAADLAALIPALGLESAVVAGQSWGGDVVVRLAAEHPELVRAVALLDGGWSDPAARFSTFEECAAVFRPAEIGDLHVDELRGRIREEHPAWSDRAVEATVANLRVGPENGLVTRRLPVDRQMEILRSMYDDPPRLYHGAVRAPALLMPALPDDAEAAAPARAQVAQAAAAMPLARVEEYVGAEHDLHAQHPHRVAASLITLAKEAG